MIKMILTDLDGTFFHDDKTFSLEALSQLIDELEGKGILFGVASGRPIVSLRKFFGDLLHKMVVICSNGCILMMNGQVVHRADLTDDDVRYLLDAISKIDDVEIYLDGLERVFYSSDHPSFLALMDKYNLPSTRLDSIYDAFEQDEIFKIGLYDAIDPLTHGVPALQSVTDRFLLVPSGDEWLDIVKKGEDKGSCLKRLQDLLGIRPEETMCFGDYYNDLQLFEHCRHSWAMKNAPDDVKEAAGNVTEYDNNEDGVIRTIRDYILTE